MLCERAERILPQARAIFQARKHRAEQFSLADAHLTRHPDVGDVLAAGGIDQMRHRVKARREFRAAQRYRSQVRRLVHRDRADPIGEAERLRAAKRGGAQRCMDPLGCHGPIRIGFYGIWLRQLDPDGPEEFALAQDLVPGQSPVPVVEGAGAERRDGRP